MPLEFFAPGVFIDDPWRARPVRPAVAPPADEIVSSAVMRRPAVVPTPGAVGNGACLVPEQPVMLVVKYRRDGPWAMLF
jgi:hypothetical protein